MKKQASAVKGTWRLLNRDGTYNVERVGPHGDWRKDLYHSVLTMSWSQFLGSVAAIYLVSNLLFAALYFSCGPHGLAHTDQSLLPNGEGDRFLECFFFSVQTSATIGYGRLVPDSLIANIMVTIEAFSALLGIAVVTGVVFARFSRPTARVVFSKLAVINRHDDIPSFIFRLANLRSNQIVEAQISVTLSKMEKTAEGETYRNFYDLKLERARSPMFVLSWTVVHPIDHASPLHGMSHQDWVDQEAEVLVGLTGMDETFVQPIHSRFSYGPDDIRWNYRFVDIFGRSVARKAVLDTSKIDLVVPV
jgi:inward rectifier potassium channel